MFAKLARHIPDFVALERVFPEDGIENGECMADLVD